VSCLFYMRRSLRLIAKFLFEINTERLIGWVWGL
jgi:hypothetical protein